MRRKPIVVVGSINMDLVAGSPRIPAPGETVMGRDFCTFSGGKGANQAVAVAKVGWPVHLVGKVGRDSFGRDLRASLEQAGVNVSAVDVTEGESGVALIVTDDHGQNSIVVAPGANNLVSPENIQKNRDLISSAGFVLCQLEIPLESVLYLAQLCAGEGVPLMLDPAPARILPEELLSRVSWITPNESETRRLLGPDFTEDGKDDESVLAERILKLGPKNVVLKLGQNGCYVIASSPALQFRSRAYDWKGWIPLRRATHSMVYLPRPYFRGSACLTPSALPRPRQQSRSRVAAPSLPCPLILKWRTFFKHVGLNKFSFNTVHALDAAD